MRNGSRHAVIPYPAFQTSGFLIQPDTSHPSVASRRVAGVARAYVAGAALPVADAHPLTGRNARRLLGQALPAVTGKLRRLRPANPGF